MQSYKNWQVWNVPGLVILIMAATITFGSSRFWTMATFSSGVPIAAASVCITNPVVNTTADSGLGSLREAIAEACAGSTITFAITGTITLTSGPLDIEQNLTIQGPGAGKLTVSGNNDTQSVFTIGLSNPGINVTVSGLTITGGNANSGPFSEGGGILYQGTDTLTVTGCTVSGNQAVGGGAGILNVQGKLVVTDSTVSGNTSSGSEIAGVGILVTTGAATITGSTISGNMGPGGSHSEGGGVFVISGLLTMINSTVTGNSVSANFAGAGGVFVAGESSITNCTITGNSVSGTSGGSGNGGGLIVSRGSSCLLMNTIIALNTAMGASNGGPDVEGFIASQGHNLIGVADGFSSGLTNGVNGDQVGSITQPLNPMLGPLGNNGGPTETLALSAGSPAIDAGDDSVLQAPLMLTTDQRGPGFARKAGAHVDIGAFEVQFNTCLVDNTTGNLLQWNSTTGAYTFTNCSTGFTLSGTGTVSLVNNVLMLTDNKSDRRVSAAWNTAERTGTANIYVVVGQGISQLFRINDTNPSALCACGG